MNDTPWSDARLPTPSMPVDRTFEGFLDLDWVELKPDFSHVRFQARDNLMQPLGLLHGGIYCAVAETVASVATTHEVWQEGFTAMGLRNSANFLRPVTAGIVDVIAILRHRGEDEWLWTHEFRDEQERLCAVVDAAIAVRPLNRSTTRHVTVPD